MPRVWEKIVERLQEAERHSTPTKRMLMRWALAKGREHSDLVLRHGPSQKATLGYKLAHRLVLRYITLENNNCRVQLDFFDLFLQ